MYLERKYQLGTLFLRLLLETGPSFYVVIRARQRSSHLQGKGSEYWSGPGICPEIHAVAKMAEIAINRQIDNKSSNENLASNLNICRILDIANPLAIFRCLCQTRGQVIFRHLCQIRHFCQNRHSPWGHFWHPV